MYYLSINLERVQTASAVSRMNFKLAFIALFVIVANFVVSGSPAPKPDGDVHVYMKGMES